MVATFLILLELTACYIASSLRLLHIELKLGEDH